ncbi:MAG: hemolysin family protein [Pseudomonadota bacterium]
MEAPTPAAPPSDPNEIVGRPEGEPPDDEHREQDEDQGGWFFGWMRRASGIGNGQEEDGEDADALGPAFRNSTADELGMVRNILRLGELRVEDVMTPRADIVAVAEDADLATVMAAFSKGSLSRVPVYRETLDDPIGFVHLKDLALAYGVGCALGAETPFRLTEHLRTALFVPPSMPIAALLKKMQGTRVHMALVIDEFGGVDGIITIEDLVEQVVGDIEDEHDEDEGTLWREERPGVWVVNARADIAEFEAAAGISLTPEDREEEADTLGGLVFMLTGRVPVRAEVISHPDGHEFQVVDADPRRIKRLRLTLTGTGARQIDPSRKTAG